MTKYLSFVVCFLLSYFVTAQLVIQSIRRSEHENVAASSRHFQQSTFNNTLPFWDDFSISDRHADSIRIWGADTFSLWDYELSKNVLINATLAVNPPTFNVATFDGLDAEGAFHDTDLVHGLADELVSESLNLESFSEDDNVYFSFFWQGGGHVETPDEADSLRLQFLNRDSVWVNVWNQAGGKILNDTVFTQEILSVDTSFLNDKFRFRFQSFGDLNGSFDAWHIDWVYLNRNRSVNDISYLDRAFSGQLTSPFSPFSAVPIHQLRENPELFIGNQQILISNLDRINPQPIDYRHTITDVLSKQVLFLNEREAVSPLLSPNTIQTVPLDNIIFSSIPTGDSVILKAEVVILDAGDVFLDNSVVDLRINDTVRANYILQNYYAFDDGTAEYAVGTNILGGQVAVQYWVNEPDTLTHIDMNFPNIAPAANGRSLILRIVNALEDENPITSQQVSVITNSDINAFTRYKLDNPVVVSDTFFIIYEQNVNEFIGVGFDRSNKEASKYIFENTLDEWTRNSGLKGAMMIRPVFSRLLNPVLSTNPSVEEMAFFPNPVQHYLKIKGDYQRIEILNVMGEVIIKQKKQSIHFLLHLPTGLYFLKIYNTLNKFQTYKMIKQ